MTVKKNFEQVYNFLLENKNKKIATVLEELEEMMKPKVASKTFRLNDDGEVTHVFCYYHKEWEDVSEVEYGKKSSTASGLNTMCKQGVSHWTKQQRVLKQTKSNLLEQVTTGEIEVTDLQELIAQAEEDSKAIIPLEV